MNEFFATLAVLLLLVFSIYIPAKLLARKFAPQNKPKDYDADAAAANPQWPANRLTMHSRQVS